MINNDVNNCSTCTCFPLCFSALSDDQMNEINQTKMSISYQKNETIVKQGTFSSHIIYVKKGVMKEYLEHESRNTFVNLLTEGQMIGLDHLFSNDPFAYSTMSYTDVHVCMFEKKLFEAFISSNHDFAADIFRKSANHNKRWLQLIHILTHMNTHERLAYAMIYLDNPNLIKHNLLEVISKKELAELAHISTDSLTALLKELSSKKIIIDEKVGIKIINHNKLKNMIPRL